MENSINYLYPTLAMQTVSSVLIGKQPHNAPTPPRAMRAEITVNGSWEHVPSVRGILYHLLKKGVHQVPGCVPCSAGDCTPQGCLEGQEKLSSELVLAVDQPIWISNIYHGDCTASLCPTACLYAWRKNTLLVAMASPQKHLHKCSQKLSSPFHPVSSKATF